MKKKLYLLTLVLLTSMLFVACSSSEDAKESKDTESETEETSSDKGGSVDWTTYEFSVNGKTLSLPCNYEEIKNASGFYMKSTDEKSYLGSGYYDSVTFVYGEDEKLALYTNVTNLSDSDQQYIDCPITCVRQSQTLVEDYGAALVTFPGDLVVGMEITSEELTEMFGEPDEVYEWTSDSDDSGSKEYTWQQDERYSTRNYYEIEITDGVITELALHHIE